ncbi:hypothetical protein [Scytonema sp. NUACC26]|uniref:hypothetical protein n=1 Tax=Scytonema sp. NUACC26 TaxID=3140176 RepID=UPI0034DBCB0F
MTKTWKPICSTHEVSLRFAINGMTVKQIKQLCTKLGGIEKRYRTMKRHELIEMLFQNYCGFDENFMVRISPDDDMVEQVANQIGAESMRKMNLVPKFFFEDERQTMNRKQTVEIEWFTPNDKLPEQAVIVLVNTGTQIMIGYYGSYNRWFYFAGNKFNKIDYLLNVKEWAHLPSDIDSIASEVSPISLSHD